MASRTVGDEFKESVFLLLGPSGGGKSSTGNFLAGELLFPIRGSPSAEQTTQCNFKYKDMNVRLIDTVGFNEMTRSDILVQIELTKAVLMAADAGGVHQFLICADLRSPNPMSVLSVDVVSALNDLDEMRTIWPHVMLLITNAAKSGYTRHLRAEEIHQFISTRCPEELAWLLKKDKTLVLEYDDLATYHRFRERTLSAIIDWAEFSVRRHGVYSNAMMQEAKQCWEEYKLEVEENEMQASDTHSLSYAELAKWIIGDSIMPSGRLKPFSHIYRSIQEYRRKRHEA